MHRRACLQIAFTIAVPKTQNQNCLPTQNHKQRRRGLTLSSVVTGTEPVLRNKMCAAHYAKSAECRASTATPGYVCPWLPLRFLKRFTTYQMVTAIGNQISQLIKRRSCHQGLVGPHTSTSHCPPHPKRENDRAVAANGHRIQTQIKPVMLRTLKVVNSVIAHNAKLNGAQSGAAFVQ